MRAAVFYSGCGGGVLGLRSAGVDVEHAIDWLPEACETLEANLATRNKCIDIREVEPADLPEVDVFVGMLKPVTFFRANDRYLIADDKYGQLFVEWCRLLRASRPRYFYIEASAGIAATNSGDGLKLMLATLLRLGYRVAYEKHDAAKFGVPTSRERFGIFGVLPSDWRGSFRFPEQTHRLAGDTKAEKWLPVSPSLLDAIGDQVEEVLIASMPSGGVHEDEETESVAVDVNYAEPQPCNRPVIEPPSGETLLFVRDRDEGAEPRSREMTVRECARVCGFPDWWEVDGDAKAARELLTTSMPPLIAKRIGKALLDYDRRKVRRPR